MNCQFLQHGISIAYDRVVKPCCMWRYDQTYANTHKIGMHDLVHWHDSPEISKVRKQMADGIWPSECKWCENHESAGRFDSMRNNSNQAYADFMPNDITLEIRPGTVCNFACQTCWPEASTRVRDFYLRAGIVPIEDVSSTTLRNFDFLSSIKHRIKNVVILGGEPFYDPDCRRFLTWTADNLDCKIMMFTNGSMIDWDWVDRYPSAIVLVFSLDAVGSAAEYVRFGTDWETVWQNFQRARGIAKVETRVNITMSIYNFFYLGDLIESLLHDWPAVVTFGTPEGSTKTGIDQSTFDERLVPDTYRPDLISRLQLLCTKVNTTHIEPGQKHTAVNAVQGVINRLRSVPYDHSAFCKWREFVRQMDRVKHINIVDHCPELAAILQHQTC